MSDHDHQALRPREGDVHPVRIQQKLDAARRVVAFAGAHRDDHHGRLLTLELVHRPDPNVLGKALLELAHLHVVGSDHEDVRFARVTIDKPHALRFADSVSLTLEYRSDASARLAVLEKAS